ncbi:MAG TPA: toprim domain-containing protein, partial [Flavobacteriales bacterium]|nr:toprim domain-containing protein [Flavobacteriales bacterium]
VIKARIEAQEQQENLEKRNKSLSWWSNMPLCKQSDYLNKKQINSVLNVLEFRAGSTQQDGDFIAYPLYNLANGDQVGFERIYSIGGKKVSTGAGGDVVYYGLIKGDSDLPVYVTEGMADAYTVHLATGATVYIAISTSNIEKIVKHLVPNTKQAVIVAIDNDEAGHKAVEKIVLDNGAFIAAAPYKQKDFNDVLVKEGLEAVQEQLNANLVYAYMTEHNKYFTSEIQEGFVNLLIGEKGTGKTTSVKAFIDTLPRELSVLVVTHRRTLNQQIASDLGFDYYEDVKEILGKESLQDSNRLVCSPESLVNITSNRQYDLVFIDECEQVLAHCTKSDTMRGNAKLSTDMLTSFCYRADTVILSDANLSSNTYTFMDNMGNKDVMKLVNTFKPRTEQKAKVYVYASKAEVVGMAQNDERKAYCFSDEKERAVEFAEARTGETLLVTSATIDSVSGIMENINDHVKSYSTVCGSPSMGTGVSVDEG